MATKYNKAQKPISIEFKRTKTSVSLETFAVTAIVHCTKQLLRQDTRNRTPSVPYSQIKAGVGLGLTLFQRGNHNNVTKILEHEGHQGNEEQRN